MAFCIAARQVTDDVRKVVVTGGQENISTVQERSFGWAAEEADQAVIDMVPQAYNGA